MAAFLWPILVPVALACAPAAHAAPVVRPWTPPNADSMVVWAAEARARFQTNQGDSVAGPNYRAYERVGSLGRRLLRSLGGAGMKQAHVVEAALDSMGFDTEIASDPALPTFVLLMVHNPYRRSAESVGFFYWMRERDLRQQGLIFFGGRHPRMRAWWTARDEAPYAWGVVTDDPRDDDRMDLLFLRLNKAATFWMPVQYGSSGPFLGGPGDAQWTDPNHDGVPELSVWTRARGDSIFEECAECPHLITESLYVVGEAGYELFDNRLVATPYATFTLFIRLLREQNRTAAARLLEKPERVSEAIAQGWGGGRGRGVWKLEYAEQGRAWPRRLAFRFEGPGGPVRYAVQFTQRDGRWLISDWKVPRPARTGAEVRP